MNNPHEAIKDNGILDGNPVGRFVIQPLFFWAALGSFFVLLQLFVFGSWLLSGQTSPIATGIDPVPSQVKISAWVTQFNVIFFLILCVFYCIRKSLRERQITWDALLIVGGLSVCWLDTAVNFFDPIVLYNSYMINWGSWSSFIPGWVSSANQLTPEPIVFVVGLYGWWFVLFGMTFCTVLRKVKYRWPGTGFFGLVGIGFLSLVILDILLEVVFVFSGLYAYNRVIPIMTVWPGEIYQMPMYGPLIIAALCTPVAVLRYQASVDGVSSIERTDKRFPVSPGFRISFRFLAMIGFVNVMYLFAVLVYWCLGAYSGVGGRGIG